MNIEMDTRCRRCGQKQEYLNHELTVIPFIRDGAYIGESKKQKCCNISFYCGRCQVNQSTPFPYQNEEVVPNFIADVKKHTVIFNAKEYQEI